MASLYDTYVDVHLNTKPMEKEAKSLQQKLEKAFEGLKVKVDDKALTELTKKVQSVGDTPIDIPVLADDTDFKMPQPEPLKVPVKPDTTELSALERQIKNIEANKIKLDVKVQGIENARANVGGFIDSVGGFAKAGLAMAATGTIGFVAAGRAAWNMMKQVEDATVLLKAYTGSATAAANITSQLVAYAQSDEGVLFQRGDLLDAASNLAIYGAEAGKLVDHVKVMGKVVALGKTSFQELSFILGRVGASGRLTGMDFDVLVGRGVKLDDTMRNASVTFDELFTAINGAIPEGVMEGRVDSITGRTIRLQSSIRNLGVELLGIRTETDEFGNSVTKFTKGGAGDRLLNFMVDLTETLRSPEVKNAFAKMGQAMVTFAEKVIPKLLKAAVFLAENMDKLIFVFGAFVALWASAKIVDMGLAISAMFLKVSSAAQTATIKTMLFTDALKKTPSTFADTYRQTVAASTATNAFGVATNRASAVTKSATASLNNFGGAATKAGGALKAAGIIGITILATNAIMDLASAQDRAKEKAQNLADSAKKIGLALAYDTSATKGIERIDVILEQIADSGGEAAKALENLKRSSGDEGLIKELLGDPKKYEEQMKYLGDVADKHLGTGLTRKAREFGDSMVNWMTASKFKNSSFLYGNEGHKANKASEEMKDLRDQALEIEKNGLMTKAAEASKLKMDELSASFTRAATQLEKDGDLGKAYESTIESTKLLALEQSKAAAVNQNTTDTTVENAEQMAQAYEDLYNKLQSGMPDINDVFAEKFELKLGGPTMKQITKNMAKFKEVMATFGADISFIMAQGVTYEPLARKFQELGPAAGGKAAQEFSGALKKALETGDYSVVNAFADMYLGVEASSAEYGRRSADMAYTNLSTTIEEKPPVDVGKKLTVTPESVLNLNNSVTNAGTSAGKAGGTATTKGFIGSFVPTFNSDAKPKIQSKADEIKNIFSSSGLSGGERFAIDFYTKMNNKFTAYKPQFQAQSKTMNTWLTSGLRPAGQNAKGTNNWRGGLTWVGEEGPELVDLPRGSKVIPNERSMAMASANTTSYGGDTVTNNFYGASDAEILAKVIAKDNIRRRKAFA